VTVVLLTHSRFDAGPGHKLRSSRSQAESWEQDKEELGISREQGGRQVDERRGS